MNKIGNIIRKTREQNGITQDVMALELEMTQGNYGRLEKDDSRLTVPKLEKISQILNVSVSYLFGEQATNIIENNTGDNAQASIGTLIQSDKEHIQSLKEEILFLREQLIKK